MLSDDRAVLKAYQMLSQLSPAYAENISSKVK